MARFLIKEDAYINIGEEWEQIELTPNGKQSRKRWPVGTYVNFDRAKGIYTEQYLNSPDGMIVSTKDDPQYPNDFIFKGPIHPDWEPLDEEARQLQRMAPRGVSPMSEEAMPSTLAPPEPKAPDDKPDPLAELKKQMAQLAGELSLIRGERDELREQNRQLREQEPNETDRQLDEVRTNERSAQPSLM